MAKKSTKIYCVYCGVENVVTDKKCCKCKKELNPKNRPFRDYLKSKIKEKFAGDLKDNMFSVITNFIKSHLYGSVLTCSVVISAVAVVVNVISNGNNFEKVDVRPDIIREVEYAGSGLDAEELMEVYLKALDENDVYTSRSLELKNFYPEIYESLKGAVSVRTELGTTTAVSSSELFDNREYVFKQESGYRIGYEYAMVSEGSYGDYNFVKRAIFITYCYENNCDISNNSFFIYYILELIEVDGDYYVNGSFKQAPMSVDQQVNYTYLMNNKGEVSKFSKQDIEDHINSIY